MMKAVEIFMYVYEMLATWLLIECRGSIAASFVIDDCLHSRLYVIFFDTVCYIFIPVAVGVIVTLKFAQPLH